MSTVGVVDDLTDSELRSSTIETSKLMASPLSSLSQFTRDDDDDDEQVGQRQQQSPVGTTNVRFPEKDLLEQVHHFVVPTPQPSVETQSLQVDELDTTEEKFDAEELRERTRQELSDLRYAEMTPPVSTVGVEKKLPERVHHFDAPTPQPSVDQLDTSPENELRQRTRQELRDLRNAEITPPDYDPSWD